jgi:hypothetical protein
MAALLQDPDRPHRLPSGSAVGHVGPERGPRPAPCPGHAGGRGRNRVVDRPLPAAVLVLALILFGGSLVDAAAGVEGEPPRVKPGPAEVVPDAAGSVQVVQPGQTYWVIAEGLDGTGDIRARVDALQEANQARPLRAGDLLVVPALE